MKVIHRNLADGKWYKMNLNEQMGHIGSEFSRALHRKQAGSKTDMMKSFERMIELVDLTIMDRKLKGRRREIFILRNVLCDYFLGLKIFSIFPESLNQYFLHFALCFARSKNNDLASKKFHL